MKAIRIGLALAGILLPVHAAGFADAVISYTPGTGYTAGYTTPGAALGEPSRVTPGEFGGPVDPFDPPYLAEQIVSIGAGGELTLRFDSPVANLASNPFGLDFSIYGNSGFVITNNDYSGGGITDGTQFGASTGISRVSVSADGTTYYELTPSLAPVIDRFFPTDGSGSFQVPMNPALSPQSFAGRDLAGIRALYAGSAGGAGYDISWARNAKGEPVSLDSIQYLRVEMLNGAAEIDGIAAVPEPGVWVFFTAGAVVLALWCRKEAEHARV